ncbi:MAG: hypothetical protein ACJ71C_07415 [Nitrososphaeraceae archaeon]
MFFYRLAEEQQLKQQQSVSTLSTPASGLSPSLPSSQQEQKQNQQ